MRVLVWVSRTTWRACVDAAARMVHDGSAAEVTLLHVPEPDAPEAAHAAFTGLLGRRRHADPAPVITAEARVAGERLLAEAAGRLGSPCATLMPEGRPERAVVSAAAGADLLIAGRDGDTTRLGPHSLRPPLRFVLDHAPCQVLLVWPGEAPGTHTIPPPPAPGDRPPRPPG
ncbi:MAG: universal stress protein [Thermoleophilia bacterium]